MNLVYNEISKSSNLTELTEVRHISISVRNTPKVGFFRETPHLKDKEFVRIYNEMNFGTLKESHSSEYPRPRCIY